MKITNVEAITKLHDQLTAETVDETWLHQNEWLGNMFLEVNCRYGA